MYYKITQGYVTQAFEDDDTPIGQRFVAGDDVRYEAGHGCSQEFVPNGYQPFNMEQPLPRG